MSSIKADSVLSEISGIRKQLHRCPELGFCEYETSKLVADFLLEAGLEVKTGIAHTGVVGILDSGKP